jgi:hypothetical protein
MSANGEGLMSQSHQYPGSPTQAATYTSNFATTTQQQTTMTTSNQFNNTYIPTYQQNVSSNPQYLGQAQNLLYQQQAVPQWPQKTQEFLVPQPQPAPTPAPAITSYPVPFSAALGRPGPSTTSAAADDIVSTATSIFPATIDRSSTTSYN